MPEIRDCATGVRGVKESASFTLTKVCKAHRASIGGLLAEHGLHVGQEMVLMDLWEDDGLRGGELAVRVGLEPPTVTKMLRRLERCGLVERRPDPKDARSFRFYLTKEGRSLLRPILRCWERAEEAALAGFSHKEVQTFRRLLIRVRTNLDPEFGAER
jgi:DNA-binding MarR family transcriptional regulator